MENSINYLKNINAGIDDVFASNKRAYQFISDNSCFSSDSIATSSTFSNNDQSKIDAALFNVDIISNNLAFQKIKDKEHKYKTSSSEFFKKWMNGEIASSPEIIDWMNSYQNLLSV
jgi:hypothetical protein